MNAARVEEQSDIQAALQEMQRRNVTVYRHARIELARIPGAEKLRVRVTKEEGDAGAADFKPGEDADSESTAGELATGEFGAERQAAVGAE